MLSLVRLMTEEMEKGLGSNEEVMIDVVMINEKHLNAHLSKIKNFFIVMT
jgi:hypothetical protein